MENKEIQVLDKNEIRSINGGGFFKETGDTISHIASIFFLAFALLRFESARNKKK